MQAIPFVLVALGLGGFWWYRRRQIQKAQEPKCPVCRSRNLEGVTGEIGSGTAVLDDEFQCLDCGLDPTELDASTREIVEALRDLQRVEFPLAQVTGKAGMLALRDNSGNTADQVEHKVMEIWQTMQRVHDDYPEAFDVPVDGESERTASELLVDRVEESATSGNLMLESFFEFSNIKRAFNLRGGVQDTVETVREALAAEVERRRSETSW